MNGKIKALGLALGVLAAFAAVMAPAAMAQQGMLTSDGPVTLIGEEVGEEPDLFEVPGIKVKCEGSVYTGHKYNVSPHEPIPAEASTITITPHYENESCQTSGIFPATVRMNECDYVLHLGEQTEADKVPVTVDIVCPEGDSVEVRSYTTAAEDPSTRFCTLELPAQSGLTGLSLTDLTNGKVELTGTLGGISVTRYNHGSHSLLCPNATLSNGVLRAEDLFAGLDELGEATEIGLSSSFVEGEALLTSDGPVTLIEEENGTQSDFIEFGGIKITCPGTTYTGHKYNVTPHELAPSHATAFTITPHYDQANCKGAGLYPVTVFTNECDYVLRLGETIGTDTATTTTDIVCPAGQDVEMKFYTTAAEDPSTPFCTLSIGAQTGLTGLSANDKTNGTLQLEGVLGGIATTKTNHGAHALLCPNSSPTGSFEMHDLVTGLNELGEATEIGLSTEPETTEHV